MAGAGIIPFGVLNTSKLLPPVQHRSLVRDQNLLERRDPQWLENCKF